MYRVSFHPAVRKDLKRISPAARSEILYFVIPQLAKDPFVGAPLSGTLRPYHRYEIHAHGVSYRIAYQIFQKSREIDIIAVGPRGGFYERLSRRVRSWEFWI